MGMLPLAVTVTNSDYQILSYFLQRILINLDLLLLLRVKHPKVLDNVCYKYVYTYVMNQSMIYLHIYIGTMRLHTTGVKCSRGIGAKPSNWQRERVLRDKLEHQTGRIYSFFCSLARSWVIPIYWTWGWKHAKGLLKVVCNEWFATEQVNSQSMILNVSSIAAAAAGATTTTTTTAWTPSTTITATTMSTVTTTTALTTPRNTNTSGSSETRTSNYIS